MIRRGELAQRGSDSGPLAIEALALRDREDGNADAAGCPMEVLLEQFLSLGAACAPCAEVVDEGAACGAGWQAKPTVWSHHLSGYRSGSRFAQPKPFPSQAVTVDRAVTPQRMRPASGFATQQPRT